MIQFLSRLKGLFIHPKEEAIQMSEPLNTTGAAVSPAPVEQSTTETATTSAPNTGVKDLKAALDFIEVGINHLGIEAKYELIELAKKYL